MFLLIFVAIGANAEEIFCNAQVVEQSWALLKSAHYGLGRQEEAAFVVREPGGGLSFVLWRSTAEAMASHFVGALPKNTIAIVHTHPMNHSMPSPDDCATARRLGIPVYVLMRTAITRTLGESNETLVVGDWNPEARPVTFNMARCSSTSAKW